MYKRCELHNHTLESDGNITCRELAEIMRDEKCDIFALTDHNTISGHHKMEKDLSSMEDAPECIYGMEYTTYYGHILSPNLKEYISWENINRNQPELLARKLRAAGALAGVAHPFAEGRPFAQGCRFEMKITDFSAFDFMEIFNNCCGLHDVNEPGLNWWESLVLDGWNLAATAGMDLHGHSNFAHMFATYIECEKDTPAETALVNAIKERRTWVSKGVLLECCRDGSQLSFTVRDMKKPGYEPESSDKWLVTLTSKNGVKTVSPDETVSLADFQPGERIIPKLYRNEAVLEELACVSPVLTV